MSDNGFTDQLDLLPAEMRRQIRWCRTSEHQQMHLKRKMWFSQLTSASVISQEMTDIDQRRARQKPPVEHGNYLPNAYRRNR